MSKITLNYSIFSPSNKEVKKNIVGEKKDNLIEYTLDNMWVKISIFKHKIILNRESDDIKLSLEFEDGKSLITNYYIKDLNINIKVKTITKKLTIKDNGIDVMYDLYMNDEFSDNFDLKYEWR